MIFLRKEGEYSPFLSSVNRCLDTHISRALDKCPHIYRIAASGEHEGASSWLNDLHYPQLESIRFVTPDLDPIEVIRLIREHATEFIILPAETPFYEGIPEIEQVQEGVQPYQIAEWFSDEYIFEEGYPQNFYDQVPLPYPGILQVTIQRKNTKQKIQLLFINGDARVYAPSEEYGVMISEVCVCEACHNNDFADIYQSRSFWARAIEKLAIGGTLQFSVNEANSDAPFISDKFPPNIRAALGFSPDMVKERHISAAELFQLLPKRFQDHKPWDPLCG